MESYFAINSTQIKRPTEFEIERYKLTDSERAASGLMSMDHIARKRKFILTYDVISSVELKTILDILDTDSSFYTFQYQEGDELKSATVYTGAIPAKLARTGAIWYWRNVSFSLIER